MRAIDRVVTRVGDWLGVISGTLLVAMMTLIFVNIVLRQLSRIWPDVFRVWVGTVEVVGWTAALIAGFALLYSQKKRAHIAIDIITSRINQRVRAIIVGIMLLADAVLFGMAVNRVVYLALDLRGRGGLPPRLSDTLQIPYWWAVMILAVLVGLFAIRLLVDSMMSFQKAATEEVAEQ